ncbi:Subtilisin-like protease 2 [Colletotrichum tanaceti]|uniref:Subtilisin-like protease 2 n=1 Tax=Colletotrichum tanaceti TaxID=1306861 RepID=A0A4U6X9B4_9PEZI|nr:Subtilisin-like protease 2 [Colletotrichum tanaceti]TKW50187.1 Subtilisin-like protease 2 [Colletotrichum tanaceti]
MLPCSLHWCSLLWCLASLFLSNGVLALAQRKRSGDPSLAQPLLTPRYIFGKTSSKTSSISQSNSPLAKVRNPDDVRLQTSALGELNLISQAPPGSVPAEDLPGFAYAAEAGRGVTIYVVDFGVNINHSEWKYMNGNKSIIYSRWANGTVKNSFHGSCMASKAAGRTFGTAKNANIVMVMLEDTRGAWPLLEALEEVKKDVIKKGIKGKAIVSMSLGLPRKLFYKHELKTLKNRIIALTTEDIVVVASSGNNRKFRLYKNKATNYPARFGQNTDLILVGAVDNDGSRSWYSQGTTKELTTSAPGTIWCASFYNYSWSRADGTSAAVPAVAGVIAVWLSQDEHAARLQVPGKVAANVKAMVKEFSYPRIKGGPPVIWNGIDSSKLACKWPRPGKDCPVLAPRPNPQWSQRTLYFKLEFEKDHVMGHNYLGKWTTAGVDARSAMQWCMDKCEDKCRSIFICRIMQYKLGEEIEHFICNTYVDRNIMLSQNREREGETLTILVSRFPNKWITEWSNDLIPASIAKAGAAYK